MLRGIMLEEKWRALVRFDFSSLQGTLIENGDILREVIDCQAVTMPSLRSVQTIATRWRH